MKKKKILNIIMIFTSLIFLFNPNINMIDALPDFIAYLLLMTVIGRAAKIVPYFAECKDALRKLALVTFLRIPAMMIMFANMRTGRDIIPLFTLVFSVIELIYAISAISNGYKALCYLGERTDATPLISRYPLKKRADGTVKYSLLTIDLLKNASIVFVFVKSVLNILPEFCLLSTSNTSASKLLTFIYPFLILSALALILVLGALWGIISSIFTVRIAKSCDIEAAVNDLAGDYKLAKINNNDKAARKLSALSVLAISSLFTFDLSFSNLGNINIVPHFIYGLLILWSFMYLSESAKERCFIIVSSSVYMIFSIISSILEITFFNTYTYEDILTTKTAEIIYSTYMWLSLIETAALTAMTVFCALCFISFVKAHTYSTPDSEEYGPLDRASHKRLITKGIILFSGVGVINVLKCVDIFAWANSTLDFSDTSVSLLAISPLPWLGTLTFCMSILLTIYTLYFISDVKTDVKMKYFNN